MSDSTIPVESKIDETFDATKPRRGDGPSKRLYRWTLSLAEKPSAPWALGLIAFAESSFFPIPPDVILIPMSLAQPRRAWLYALICTIGSVLGALLGYAIGALLYNTVGEWVIHLYGYQAKMAAATDFFQKWGALAIIVKGLTPIPFKLVTTEEADLRAFMRAMKLTREGLAAQLGISRRLVGYYLEGQAIPRYIALACAGLKGRAVDETPSPISR